MTPVKGYTEMKGSGIPWIGEIPCHWDIRRNKTVFSCEKEIVGENSANIQLLSLTTNGIRKKSVDDTSGKVPESYDTYQYVHKDNLVLCLFDLDCSAVFSGLSKYEGMISPAYKVIKCNDNIVPGYADYWFRSVFDGRKFKYLAKNIRYSLTYEDFSALTLPHPPLSEQSAIAAYLDTQCAKIDEIIAQAKASIEDYKQWKASVVDECISQALTSSPQVRLKFLMTYIVDCPHETPEYCLDGDYLVIRTADQDYGFLRPDDSMYRLNEAEFHKRSRRLPLEKNDIVYGREGERWGLACLVPESGKYCLGQRIMQFRCKVDRILPHYAMWALNSRHVYLQGIVDTLGSTSPHVNISTIRNYYIPIPPIPEQRRISTYLFERCGAIDAIIKSKQFLIDDLESYKKSLIYEVVTGKRRVC